MLRCLMVEACPDDCAGSVGAFFVAHHARLAGHTVDVARTTMPGYDVEMISVHHATDFPLLAAMPKRAAFRVVGGHPMCQNPRPCIPYADVIGMGEGETWIKRVLEVIERTGDVEELTGERGTIVCRNFHQGDALPTPCWEDPLPGNPPYLNWDGTRSRAWYIELSRGCAYSCAYCELGNSVPYRAYDAERIKRAIDACDMGVTRKINLFAPEEAGNPAYDEILEYVKTKGFAAGFSSMRLDAVLKNPPSVKHNHLIRAGVDGLTEETRRRVRKSITDEMIVTYFRELSQMGHMNFKMFMIFGYPWDMRADFETWARLMDRVLAIPVQKNTSLRIKWTPFIPQPCTPLRDAGSKYETWMADWIRKWHLLHRLPARSPGWHVENDGLMTVQTHRQQVELTCGDEDTLVRMGFAPIRQARTREE